MVETATPLPLVGAVLFGGASGRMGSPKHLLTLADGRTLMEHVAAALHDARADVVVAVGDAERPAALSDMTVLRDDVAGLGPLGGLGALLASGLGRRYLVCPCDMPALRGDLLAALAASPRTAAVFKVAGESRLRPLPLAIDAGARSVVAERLDRRCLALRGLLEHLDVETLEVDDAETLLNLNAPEDLARWRSECS